jgi:hypothetical protein
MATGSLIVMLTVISFVPKATGGMPSLKPAGYIV